MIQFLDSSTKMSGIKDLLHLQVKWPWASDLSPASVFLSVKLYNNITFLICVFWASEDLIQTNILSEYEADSKNLF